MPNRMLRDGILESEAVLSLPFDGRWLFIAIVLTADDFGLFEATPFKLAKDSAVPVADVPALLKLLVERDLVRLYRVRNKAYGLVTKFGQRLRRPHSAHPLPPADLVADEPAVLVLVERAANGGHASDTRQTDVGHTSDTRQTHVGRTSDVRPTKVRRTSVTRQTNDRHASDVRPTDDGHTSDTRQSDDGHASDEGPTDDGQPSDDGQTDDGPMSDAGRPEVEVEEIQEAIPSGIAMARLPPAVEVESPRRAPRTRSTVEKVQKKAKAEAALNGHAVNGVDAIPACPQQAILVLWREVLPDVPQHRSDEWRGTRAEHLRARWRDKAAALHWHGADEGLDWFRRFFGYIRGSPFLMGRAPPSPGRPAFAIELEWLVSPGNWAKVIEGKYHPESAA